MSSLITDQIKAKAEVYYGDDMCQETSKFVLKEIGLPTGLLPLKDMVECGYNRETGFVWTKQKRQTNHMFKKINKLVSYATEVTAYVEQNRIVKLTGVKTNELLIWLTLSDIWVEDPPTSKINFGTAARLLRSFPVSAFEIKEEVKGKRNEVKEGAATVEEVKAKEV